MTKRKKRTDVLKIGKYILFISLVVLVSVGYFNSLKDKKEGKESIIKENAQQDTQQEQDDKHAWTLYANKDYAIAFSYPYLLNKRDYEDYGEYDFFVVFEENQFSVEKGVAFGVSKDGLEKEVERIKKDVSEQGKSKLVKDEKLAVDNGEAWVLEFEPEDEALEKRSFLIIEEGDYTYSFSTVPEQMQKLSESIQFLN